MKLPYRFGRYELIEKIAQGGMAEVFRARYFGEDSFVKEVAVKRILPFWSDSKEFSAMLCDEAHALVRLQHQNIVHIFELGRDGKTFYISMEYVAGVDLGKLFAKTAKGSPPQPVPIKFACFVISEILKGLDFAHSSTDKNGQSLGLTHRDISPPNILLSFSGEVKIADFGIAKGTHRSFETVAGELKGKYAYMSPEQALGHAIDARTDIYATGIIFYELLSGKRLYSAPNDILTIEAVKNACLPEDWTNDVPIGVRPILRRVLQYTKDNRYQHAADFLNDINKFAVANGQLSHNIEFSSYLKNIFKSECDAAKKRNEGVLNNIRHHRKNYTKPWTVPIVVSISALIALSGIWFLRPSTAENKTAAPRIEIPAPPKIPPMTALPISAKLTSEPQGFGAVNIQARPWGYAYIEDFLHKKETPIKGLRLKPGEYTIKIFYEPQGRWLEQKISVTNASITTCLAIFGPHPAVNCLTDNQ